MDKTTILDCKGLTCPAPVLRTKNNIEAGNLPLSVILDNKPAIENVSRMAAKLGCVVKDLKDEHGLFVLTIVSSTESETVNSSMGETAFAGSKPAGLIREGKAVIDSSGNRAETAPSVVYIGSDEMGTGDRRLGTLLMKGFVKTIKELSPLPSTIIFINSGIKLTLGNSDSTVPSLKELVDSGVEILVCGTCLDFYNGKDELAVGRISNMYEIGESLNQAFRVVRP